MDQRLWGSVLVALFVVGCPGTEVVPEVDGGRLDAPIAPGTDAPIAPGTDVPIAPGTDAPVDPDVDAATVPDAPTSPDAPSGGFVLTGPCVDDGDCDDGVDCTVDECNGGLPCPDGLRCSCHHVLDGASCGPTETCHQRMGCVPGTACARTADCVDDEVCTTGEFCDTTRRICGSRILDGDSDGDPAPICGGTDCDDTRAFIRPGLPEGCDGDDNDCDTIVDEGASVGCGPEGICVAGRCDCPDPGDTLCDEYDETLGTNVYRCHDTQTDDQNCGRCGRECGSTATCNAGSCLCDTPGLTYCGAETCLDTSADWSNCGPLCQYCGVNSNCVADVCAPCGASGQRCCAPPLFDGLRDACRAGLGCNSGGTCGACGGTGQPCCGSGSCNTGLACSSGTCRTCGAAGEPCCAGGSCDVTTLACSAATSTCALRGCALPYDPLPASYLPRCARSTLTCIRACTTSVCRQACIDADTTPPSTVGSIDCADCLSLQDLACLDDAGCGDEWARYECCYEDNCPPGSPASCATPCNAVRTAWNSCASGSTCYIDAGFSLQCFAP